jgi:YesN/AraC family two-component response regulator
LVDDSKSFLKALRLKLNDLIPGQFEFIDEAENGLEAIDLVKKKRYNIIFMDINMPVMNGVDATKYITTNYRDNFIVALSMYNDFHHLEKMLGAGARTYLEKDSLTDDLLQSIFTKYDQFMDIYSASFNEPVTIKHGDQKI